MKRILSFIVVAIMAIGAYAQQGQFGLGANVILAPAVEGPSRTNFGLGAKLQYGLSNNVRLEGDVEYLFKAKHISQFDFTVNGHYLVDITSDVTMYPIMGIGFASVKPENHPGLSKFIFNLGLGAEYAITERVAACLEIKYQYCQDVSKMPIAVGIAYKF